LWVVNAGRVPGRFCTPRGGQPETGGTGAGRSNIQVIGKALALGYLRIQQKEPSDILPGKLGFILTVG